jgi:hypothetical protein
MADKRRARTEPWKHIYERDRAYTRRFNAAANRGQLTEPGTQPNARDEKKIAARRKARQQFV